MTRNAVKEHLNTVVVAHDIILAPFTVKEMYDMAEAPKGIVCFNCKESAIRFWPRSEGMVCLSCVAKQEMGAVR